MLTTCIAPGFQPTTLYLYFKREIEAKALLQGDVWISTLERCRGYEEKGRGDPMEARSDWRISEFDSPSGLAGRDALKQTMGVTFANTKVYASAGAALRITSGLPDAYVVCTTDTMAQTTANDIGRYCVEISEPLRFFRLITDRLAACKAISVAIFGPITYASTER